jgi:hypothetical protein
MRQPYKTTQLGRPYKYVYNIDLHNEGKTATGLYYKTLQTRNLWKMDSFRSKLMPFLLTAALQFLGEHTSLDKTL